MLRDRWRQSNLFVRLAWGVALVFVLLHLLYSVRHAKEQLLSNAEVFAVTSIDRARAMVEVAQSDQELLERLSTPTFRVEVLADKPLPPAVDAHHSADVEAAARRLLQNSASEARLESAWIEGRSASGTTSWKRHRRGSNLVLVLPDDGQWLKVTTDMRSANWRNPSAGAISTVLLALALFAAVLWGMRRVTRFLPRFADAAEALGRGQSGEPMAIKGPTEVRRAAAAFNEMQRRVTDHLTERTTMLAAFSHDLRTFATRLRLRLEALPADEQRDKASADLDAMTRILDEALAFARDDMSQEPFGNVDLNSMLRSLLDDAVDGAALAGTTVIAELDTQRPMTVQAQPSGLSRAFANLIDNAIKYGGNVRVTVVPATLEPADVPGIRIRFADDGPGIPAAQHASVLRPYVRLEQSRNRATGGTGLGLAIVNSVVRRHGGVLRFVEKVGPDQPFAVEVVLPLRRRGD